MHNILLRLLVPLVSGVLTSLPTYTSIVKNFCITCGGTLLLEQHLFHLQRPGCAIKIALIISVDILFLIGFDDVQVIEHVFNFSVRPG